MAFAAAVIVAVVSILGSAVAQQQPQGCTSQLAVLLPCLRYVQGQDSSPPPGCCSALGSVVRTNPLCLCALVTAGSGAAGVNGVNKTLALQLPSKCNIQSLNPRQCSASVSSPAPAPRHSSSPSPSSRQGGRSPSRHSPTPAPSISGRSEDNSPTNVASAPSNLTSSALSSTSSFCALFASTLILICSL